MPSSIVTPGLLEGWPAAIVEVYTYDSPDGREETRAVVIPVDLDRRDEIEAALQSLPEVTIPWDIVEDDDADFELIEMMGEVVEIHRPPGLLTVDDHGTIVHRPATSS